jgi:hypothetical protein
MLLRLSVKEPQVKSLISSPCSVDGLALRPVGPLLVYATGGFAFGHVSATTAITEVFHDNFLGFTFTFPFAASSSVTLPVGPLAVDSNGCSRLNGR